MPHSNRFGWQKIIDSIDGCLYRCLWSEECSYRFSAHQGFNYMLAPGPPNRLDPISGHSGGGEEEDES